MYLTKEYTRKIFRSGFLFVLLLLFLDLITFFYYGDTRIGEIFLATREQTPLTWVSGVLLLLIGLSCGTEYLRTKSFFWYSLSIIFLFFSMDDLTYFHERFSSGMQEILPLLKSFPSYSWIVIYFPILIFGLGGLFVSLWKITALKNRKWLLLGTFLLGSSLVLDIIDGFIYKDITLVYCYIPTCNHITSHLFRLTEEIIEIFGFGIFAYFSINKFSLIQDFNKN